ncbi:MAG TPA: hypothetical protein VJB98_00965 [Candidatus Paceibacterota bacterium]
MQIAETIIGGQNAKRLFWILISLCLVGLASYCLISSKFAEESGLCLPATGYVDSMECEEIVKSVAGPAAAWSTGVLIILLLLIPLRKEVVKTIFRFSVIVLPLGWIVTILTAPICTGGLFFGCEDRMEVSSILATGYVIITILIILIKVVFGKHSRK